MFRQWYLSTSVQYQLHQFSLDMLAANGWEKQFNMTIRVLNQVQLQVDELVAGNIDRWALRKELADLLIVLTYPLEHLKITNDEIASIALKPHEIDGKKKDPKIQRTYRRVMEIENYLPIKPLQTELYNMSRKVLSHQIKDSAHKDKPGAKYFEKAGVQFQLNLAAAELGELNTELRDYKRIQKSTNKKDMQEKGMVDNRDKIKDEIFDVLYCVRYILLATGITMEELNQLINMRIKDIRLKYLGR